MTRREYFRVVLARCDKKLNEISDELIPVMGKMRILKDGMFIYPERYNEKDIRAIRCFWRFLEKKGYW